MSLERRLYTALTEAKATDFTSVFTRNHFIIQKDNIVFQTWNSNMHEGKTLEMFKDFDKLFSLVNAWSRSHELLLGCQ